MSHGRLREREKKSLHPIERPQEGSHDLTLAELLLFLYKHRFSTSVLLFLSPISASLSLSRGQFYYLSLHLSVSHPLSCLFFVPFFVSQGSFTVSIFLCLFVCYYYIFPLSFAFSLSPIFWISLFGCFNFPCPLSPLPLSLWQFWYIYLYLSFFNPFLLPPFITFSFFFISLPFSPSFPQYLFPQSCIFTLPFYPPLFPPPPLTVSSLSLLKIRQ